MAKLAQSKKKIIDYVEQYHYNDIYVIVVKNALIAYLQFLRNIKSNQLIHGDSLIARHVTN